jgi:hypothetical protein
VWFVGGLTYAIEEINVALWQAELINLTRRRCGPAHQPIDCSGAERIEGFDTRRIYLKRSCSDEALYEVVQFACVFRRPGTLRLELRLAVFGNRLQ